MPRELHNAIFAELRDPLDVVALCLTASHFWRIGVSHYKALFVDYIRHAHDWSGDRLICIGRNAGYLPKGLISEDAVEKLKASYPFPMSNEPAPRIPDLLYECSRSLRDLRWPPQHEFAYRCKLEVLNPLYLQYLDEMIETRRALDPPNDLPKSLPLYNYDFSAWLNLIREGYSIYDLESPGSFVLRNLSKKVYVCQNAFALQSGTDASRYYMSVGSVLLARIMWSPYPGKHVTWDHRGAWAGDRFDVVHIKAVKDDDGWTDVSPAAWEELCEQWEAAFGRDWENEVRKCRL